MGGFRGGLDDQYKQAAVDYSKKLQHHPDAPDTQAEVAEFGVLERGFSRETLVAGLTDAGFLPPLILRQVDIMVDEGRLAPAYISSVLAATPTYHMMLAAKPGNGAHRFTSRAAAPFVSCTS